jgi:hypothetical protein
MLAAGSILRLVRFVVEPPECPRFNPRDAGGRCDSHRGLYSSLGRCGAYMVPESSAASP